LTNLSKCSIIEAKKHKQIKKMEIENAHIGTNREFNIKYTS